MRRIVPGALVSNPCGALYQGSWLGGMSSVAMAVVKTPCKAIHRLANLPIMNNFLKYDKGCGYACWTFAMASKGLEHVHAAAFMS